MLPKIAQGDANKVWIVPSEIGKAMEGLGSAIGAIPGIPRDTDGPRTRIDPASLDLSVPETEGSRADAHAAVLEAMAEAAAAAPSSGVRPALRDAGTPKGVSGGVSGGASAVDGSTGTSVDPGTDGSAQEPRPE